MTVSCNLLASIYEIKSDFLKEISNLCTIISNHPLVPEFWIRLGKSYSKLECLNLPISSKFSKQVQSFCFIHALILLKTVERSVKSFSKDKNEKLQIDLKFKLKEMKLSEEEYERTEMFASLDIFKKRDVEKDDEKAEFEDLGKSVRLAKIEAAFQEAQEQDEKDQNDLEIVSAFEKEWFSFVIE